MNILWFTENFPPNKGGMARSCDRIVSNLRKHHQVDVYHFTNKIKPFISQANIGGSYTAVPVYEDASHTLNVLWSYISAQKQYSKTTVFVAYGSHLSLKGIPLYAKWLKLPYLLCLRGNDFDTAIFSNKKPDLLYAIKNAEAVACVSSEKVERIKNMDLNDKLFFTPNSIDASSWEILDADLSLAKDTRTGFTVTKTTVIGLVGYLKQKKGVDFFITTLLKSELSTNMHLRIVGELEPEIENKLQEWNLSYSVVVPESQSELMANYLSCDAIAIPSIYDGMPNVLFEAGILGVPILASKAGGLPDVLDDTNAFLFDPLSEESLLACISQFYRATDENLHEASKRLKTKLMQEFTPEKEVKNYLKIFKQIHN
ncbi:glycosyltransferase family 4 protein [Maribacter sp. 2308TA10-17]|uniref:glycosyltransferase family 4 protein n=1 Tax=Maribacter sp. 2308TA10-17 TaxID=3386276 RepID=UPI0039BD8A2C